MVGAVGFEPTWTWVHQVLSLARLPFRHAPGRRRLCTLGGGEGRGKREESVPCSPFRPLVVRYGEGGLPDDQVRLLREHAEECPECRRSLVLIERGDEEVAAVLLPRRGPAVPGRPVRRLVRIFALVLALFVLVLVALFAVYRGIGDRIDKGQGGRPILLDGRC